MNKTLSTLSLAFGVLTLAIAALGLGCQSATDEEVVTTVTTTMKPASKNSECKDGCTNNYNKCTASCAPGGPDTPGWDCFVRCHDLLTGCNDYCDVADPETPGKLAPPDNRPKHPSLPYFDWTPSTDKLAP